MRALLDQGLPYSAVQHLKSAGWDVLHATDAGMERASDREIIEFARQNNRYFASS